MPKEVIFEKCKQMLRLAAAVMLCAWTALGFWSVSVIKLSKTEGRREFYVGSASSQGLRRTELRLCDLGKISGESVYFQTDGVTPPRVLAMEIARSYQAEIVLEEYVSGVYGFYAYSPIFGNGIEIDGRLINLHIAMEAEGKSGAVGTPIIFGGY